MKRLLALLVCSLALGGAMTSCGGGGDDGAVAVADKLTIVGSGD